MTNLRLLRVMAAARASLTLASPAPAQPLPTKMGPFALPAARPPTALIADAGAYLGLQSGEQDAAVARFGQQFVREHGHPDRVVLEGLRYDSQKQMWQWDNVWWEYADGRRVRYPNYAELQ